MIGNSIFGLANTFGIDIFGEPMKWAKLVPTEFTFHPAIARPKPAAQMPKLAAPDPMPASEIATAIPTVVTGVTMNIEKIIAIKTLITTG